MACLLHASVLSAQGAEQSPENAHTFIQKIFNSRLVTYKVIDRYRPIWSGLSNFRGEEATTWLRIESSNGCSTQFGYPMGANGGSLKDEYDKMEIHKDATGPYDKRPTQLYSEWLEMYRWRISTPLDWSQVDKIDVHANFVNFGNQKFGFESEDMAARVGYAMQVIKDSCDATSGLGF